MNRFQVGLSTGFIVLFLSGVVRADGSIYSRTDAAEVLREVSADLALKERLGQPLTPARGQWMTQWIEGYRKDPDANTENAKAANSGFFSRIFHRHSAEAPIRTFSLSPTIMNAPFIDYLIAAQGPSLYQKAYQSQYADTFDQYVNHTPLELIFDTLIGEIIDGSAYSNPRLAATAKQIGGCLAKKVLRGKQDISACNLNIDETELKAPSFLSLAIAKTTCFLDVPTPCSVRKIIFADAKKQLIQARLDPSVHAQIVAAVSKMLPEKFPDQFEAGFFGKVEGIRSDLRTFIGNKTSSAGNPLWDKDAALVETNDRTTNAMTLHQYAVGLDADVAAAELLAKSADLVQRSYAPPLLYAAANKILLIMGGSRAKFDGKHFNAESAAIASDSPTFHANTFGGIGVDFSSGTQVTSVWDWAGYSPSQNWKPFPSQFTLNNELVTGLIAGVSPVETLDDISELLRATLHFYTATAANQPLGAYFGDASSVLDPSSPVLFPVEGRLLAIGTMAGILKNAVSTTFGHVSEIDNTRTGGSASVGFIDQMGHSGALGNPVSITSVSNLMARAIDLNNALVGDPNVPASLAAALPQLKDAIFLGTLGILAHGQASDGGFYEYWDNYGAPARKLHTQTRALELVIRYYEVSGIPVLRQNIENGFKMLGTFFAGGIAVPLSAEGSSNVQVPASDLWALIQLWDHMQIVLALTDANHAGATWDFDYPAWSARFQLLQQKLDSQMQSGTVSSLVELSQ